MSLNKIVEGLKEIRTEQIMSLNSIHAKLTKIPKFSTITLATIALWGKRTEHPKITNLAKILSSNIASAVYFYPEVESEALKYYKKTSGRRIKKSNQ